MNEPDALVLNLIVITTSDTPYGDLDPAITDVLAHHIHPLGTLFSDELIMGTCRATMGDIARANHELLPSLGEKFDVDFGPPPDLSSVGYPSEEQVERLTESVHELLRLRTFKLKYLERLHKSLVLASYALLAGPPSLEFSKNARIAEEQRRTKHMTDLRENINQNTLEIDKLTKRRSQIQDRLALHPVQVGRSTPGFSLGLGSLYTPMSTGFNATFPPMHEPTSTPSSGISDDQNISPSEPSSTRTRFHNWAHLAALVDNLSHKTRTLCGHPKIQGGAPPLINLDSLPDEVVLPLYASLKSLVKLDMIIDAILANSQKSMTAQDYQQYELATSTHGQDLVDNYQPGGLEIVLQIMPAPVIRLFSLFKVIALKDVMPLSEEYFRDAITGAVVTVDKLGVPNWTVLLNVLHSNKKHMAELGVLYDVFKTCSALLTVVKAIPRSVNTFGLTFMNHVEGLELRIQTVPYHEATKSAKIPDARSSSTGTPRWHQGHLREFIDALRAEHVRVSTHHAEIVDDPIPLDKVDASEPMDGSAAVTDHRPQGGRNGNQGGRNGDLKPPCLSFNLSNCAREDCSFDHRALRKDDRAYIDDYLKTRKRPVTFDVKKMHTMASKLGLDLTTYGCVELNAVHKVQKGSKATIKRLQAEVAALRADVSHDTTNTETEASSTPTTTTPPPTVGGHVASDAVVTVNALRLIGLSDEQSSMVALHGPDDRRMLIAKYLSGNSTEA